MKQAVCLLLPMGSGFLAVSRRNDTSKWGFPGGKVDAGETAAEAVVREVYEEVGIKLDPALLTEAFGAVCKGEVDYFTLTYKYPRIPGLHIADLKAEEGLSLAIMSKNDLRDSNQSPFSEYNARVFKVFQ